MKIRILICLAICFVWSTTALVQAQVPIVGGQTTCVSNSCSVYSAPTCTLSDSSCYSACTTACNSCCNPGCTGCTDRSSCRLARPGCAAGVAAGGLANRVSSTAYGATNWVPCSRYLSTFGGWTDWKNFDANIAVGGIASGEASLELQTKDGYTFGGALGRYVNSNIRSEMEFAYRQNSLGSASAIANLNNPNPILPGGPGNLNGAIEVDLDGRIDMYSGMCNWYYDFQCNLGRIKPYVGGGVGFAFQNIEVRTPDLPGISLTTETSAFAYQGIGGLALQWTERVRLFTEYRVFGLDEFTATITGPGANASLDFGGLTHNVVFGAQLAIR